MILPYLSKDTAHSRYSIRLDPVEGENAIPAKKKVASCSAFLLSMHVVLKTRCVNLKDYVRGF